MGVTASNSELTASNGISNHTVVNDTERSGSGLSLGALCRDLHGKTNKQHENFDLRNEIQNRILSSLKQK
jgi:hypothetical protein